MKNLLFSLLIFLFCLILAEVVLRFFVEIEDPYAHLRFKTTTSGDVIRIQNDRNKELFFVFDPTDIYPKDEPTVIPIHLNNYGFRHEEDILEPKDEIRIFAIGGSTTQNFDYVYEKTWTQVLEKNLEKELQKKVRVYNGGTAGAATVDHIALLQNRVLHLKPDAVILFSGINDLNMLLGDDNLFRFRDVIENSEPISWYKLGLARLTIYRLWLRTKASLESNFSKNQPVETERPINPVIPKGSTTWFMSHKALVEETRNMPSGDVNAVSTEYYTTMVRSFIGASKANKIPVVFITQPVTWGTTDEELAAKQWMNKAKGEKLDKTILSQYMQSMNKNAASAAEELDALVFRAEDILPKTKEFFFDDCHFTPDGSVAFGNSLFTFLKEETSFLENYGR